MHVFDGLRKQQEEVVRSLGVGRLTSLSSMMSEMAGVNRIWHDLAVQKTLSQPMVEHFDQVHKTWMARLAPALDRAIYLEALVKVNFADMSRQLLITQHLVAGIDFDAITHNLAIGEAAVKRVETSIGNLVSSYGMLAKSIGSYADLVQLPAYVLPGATREVFLTSYVVDTLHTVVEREPDQAADELFGEAKTEIAECLPLLQTLEPGLVRPYTGAHEALNGSGTDRQRHVLTSLRELTNHVLHLLAPDKDVLGWIPEGDMEFIHCGRPTRRARVFYICRNVNSGPFTRFVDDDTRTTVDMLGLLNHVHELGSTLTEEQLLALFYKVESWLLYVLRLARDQY